MKNAFHIGIEVLALTNTKRNFLSLLFLDFYV